MFCALSIGSLKVKSWSYVEIVLNLQKEQRNCPEQLVLCPKEYLHNFTQSWSWKRPGSRTKVVWRLKCRYGWNLGVFTSKTSWKGQSNTVVLRSRILQQTPSSVQASSLLSTSICMIDSNVPSALSQFCPHWLLSDPISAGSDSLMLAVLAVELLEASLAALVTPQEVHCQQRLSQSLLDSWSPKTAGHRWSMIPVNSQTPKKRGPGRRPFCSCQETSRKLPTGHLQLIYGPLWQALQWGNSFAVFQEIIEVGPMREGVAAHSNPPPRVRHLPQTQPEATKQLQLFWKCMACSGINTNIVL